MKLLIIVCITTYTFAIHIERTLDRISKNINGFKSLSSAVSTVTPTPIPKIDLTSSPETTLKSADPSSLLIASLSEESSHPLNAVLESSAKSNYMFTPPTSFSGDSREYIYFGYFSEPMPYHDQIIKNRLEGPYITAEGLYIYRRRMLDF